MEKFTIGELTEPFLTYEEFAGQKEKERAEQKKAETTITEQETGKDIILECTEMPGISDKEITSRVESPVTTEEVFVQDKPYEIPEQYKEKPEEQKELPAVSDVQIRKEWARLRIGGVNEDLGIN